MSKKMSYFKAVAKQRGWNYSIETIRCLGARMRQPENPNRSVYLHRVNSPVGIAWHYDSVIVYIGQFIVMGIEQ